MEREEKLIKAYRMNRLKVISNVILILLFIGIFIYMIVNVETLKLLQGDVCQLCMQKTGASCWCIENTLMP